MGNKSGKVTSSDFNQKDWQATDRQNSQHQAKGNYRILQNTRTGQLIDQYQLFWMSQQDFLFYLDSYNWRKQEYNIVQSRFIVEQHNQQFCSKSFAAKVFIEHIPTRLSDVTDIPFPDNLYVALTTLQGYQKLYQNVHHYFPISEDQVCVDKQGCVKVWVNSDLSKNYPQTELYVDKDHKDQSHMVEQILSLIWQNTDQQSQPASFRQFYQKKKGKKRIGFDQAKVIVNQYAKNISCQIPQKFISILQMRQQSQQYGDDTRNQQMQQNEALGQHEQLQYRHGQQVPQYQNYPMHHQHHHMHNMNNGGHVMNHGGYVVHNGAPQDYEQQQMQLANEQSGSQTTHTFYPIVHNTNNLVYHQQYSPLQYGPVGIPQPLIINQQFIPKVIAPQTGPIISIPPARGNFYQPHIPIQYQHIRGPAPIIHRGDHIPNQLGQNGLSNIGTLTRINEQRPQSNQKYYNNNEVQAGFSNSNQPFQQRVSTLNQHNDDHYSEQHRYSQQPTYNGPTQYNQQHDQFHQVNQIRASQQRYNNSPVNRSLQLIKKSQKKISQTEQLKVNKSHINQGMYKDAQKSLNYEQQISYNNSRHSGGPSGNSRNDDNRSRLEQNYGYHQEEYNDRVDDLYDTKYYTLDTEIELDEEIAADLKKFIMAS